jgi:hypothetical protein
MLTNCKSVEVQVVWGQREILSYSVSQPWFVHSFITVSVEPVRSQIGTNIRDCVLAAMPEDNREKVG